MSQSCSNLRPSQYSAVTFWPIVVLVLFPVVLSSFLLMSESAQFLLMLCPISVNLVLSLFYSHTSALPRIAWLYGYICVYGLYYACSALGVTSYNSIGQLFCGTWPFVANWKITSMAAASEQWSKEKHPSYYFIDPHDLYGPCVITIWASMQPFWLNYIDQTNSQS